MQIAAAMANRRGQQQGGPSKSGNASDQNCAQQQQPNSSSGPEMISYMLHPQTKELEARLMGLTIVKFFLSLVLIPP
jgi:transcription initiation factor TFIID subunit TAF12